jgi:uncharacterized membrane protein
MTTSVNFIHAFCIYCMISAILTVLLAATALSHASAARTAS